MTAMRSHSPSVSPGAQQLAFSDPAPDREAGPATGATLNELMTADQVAELLLMPASTVKDYARRDTLPSIKLGKHRRFVRSQVQATLDALAGSSR